MAPKDVQKTPREPWTPWGKWAKRRRERQRQREEQRRQRQLERQKRRARRRLFMARGVVFLGLGLMACTVAFIVTLLIGQPYPWQTLAEVTGSIRTARELEASRTRWQSLGVERYTVTVEYRSVDGSVCGPAEIEVESGQVVSSPERETLNWSPRETCNERLPHFTVEGALEDAEQLTQDFRPGIDSLRVSFDPDFGYPIRIRTDVYTDEAPEWCCWTATWRDLRPIDD